MKHSIKTIAGLGFAMGFALAIGPAFGPRAAGAEAFEGILDLAFASPAMKNEATGYMKGQAFTIRPKVSVAMDGVEGYPILDFAAKKFYIVAPKDKYYLTLPLAQLEAPIDKAPAKVKKSGKTDSIASHAVEEWVLDDPAAKGSFSIWATKDYRTDFNFYLSLQKTAPVEGLVLGRMAKAIIAEGWFPMAAEARDAKGTVTVSMRILSMEARKLEDSWFAIPEGFGKMSDALKKKK